MGVKGFIGEVGDGLKQFDRNHRGLVDSLVIGGMAGALTGVAVGAEVMAKDLHEQRRSDTTNRLGQIGCHVVAFGSSYVLARGVEQLITGK